MFYSNPSVDRWRPSSVIVGAFIMVSVGCTAKERDLSALMQAGESSTGGHAGTTTIGGASTTNTLATGGRGNQGGTSGLGGSSGGLSGVGGNSGSAASSSTGGTTSSSVTSVGGSGLALGGTSSAGGAPGGTGGTTNKGGSTSAVPTGGLSSAGGAGSTGGTVNKGGTVGTGGVVATGGAASTVAGGAVSTGGTVNTGTGGTVSTGGSVGQGGTVSTGGVLSTGGVVSTGGAVSTGGTTAAVGPSVVITYGSVADAGNTNLTTATFAFSSSPSGAVKYECSLNSTSSYTDCTSSLSLTGLDGGAQELNVRAYNSSSVVGPVLKRTWTVTSLSTTIKAIRANSVAVDTLVAISTNVRLTGMYTVSGSQVVFVQEAAYVGTPPGTSVDDATNLSGDAVLNSGILTRPLATQATKSLGTAVTVIGALKSNQNNAELVRANYVWGTAGTAATEYAPVPLRAGDTTVLGESLEGVYIQLGGQVPAYDCSSGCFNTNGYPCLQACFGQCRPLTWTQIPGTIATNSGWGDWRGFLVQTGTYYTMWVVDSDTRGDDVCM